MPEEWREQRWTGRSAKSSLKSIAYVTTRVWARSSTVTARHATSTSASSKAARRPVQLPPSHRSARSAKRRHAGVFEASLTGTPEEQPPELSDGEPRDFDHPTQTPYFHALERERYARQTQLRAIETHTGRRLICLASSPYAEITRDIITVFADLLHDVDKGAPLDLLLNTPGGDIDAAEKLVIMCRSRCSSFRIIVPESAKSAGTMMCCAADSVVMGFASELGPIDPQIYVPDSSGRQISRPAHSFLAGFDEIKEATQKAGELSPAYYPLLDKLDPALLEFCRTSIKRAEQFAGNWLKKYQCKDDEEKAERIAAHLGDVTRFRSHGAAIDAKEARE